MLAARRMLSTGICNAIRYIKYTIKVCIRFIALPSYVKKISTDLCIKTAISILFMLVYINGFTGVPS